MAMEALRVAAKESKFMKFILGGFIFLAVGGLVFTDVGGYFTGGTNGTTVARVGDTKIDIREFDSELRGFLQQANISAEDAYNTGIINALLQGKISSILKSQAAQDLDLVLDNQAIANQIKHTFKGASKEQITMTLRAQGISEKELANSIQLQAISRFVDQMPLSISNYVPSYINDVNAKIASEQRSGTLYTVPLSSLTDDITVSDADIENYYQSNQDQFTVAQERIFSIGKMTLDMAKKNLPSVTEADIRADYDSRLSDFTIPETRTLSQAVVKDPDVAQSIYETVLSGESLKNALGDKGTYRAPNGYQADALPPELSEQAFAPTIETGDVTPPVKTLLGYVVMQVTDITTETLKPYKSVKADIKKQIEQAAIYDSLYNKMIDTEDMIDNGQTFNDIATKTGLKISKTKFVSLQNIFNIDGDLKTAVDSNPSIVEEIFSLPTNNASYPLELDDETYIVIGVDTVHPESILPFEDVKNEISKTLLTQARESQAKIQLEQLISDLNSGEKSTNDIKGKSKSFKNLKQDTESKNKELIFSTELNSFGYKLDGGNAIITTITNINFDNKTADIKTDDITRAQREMIDSLLMQYYRNNTSITVNDQLLKQAYAPSQQ